LTFDRQPHAAYFSAAMTIDQYANRFVCDLVAYEPGKPIDETARELGMDPALIVKVASNENPLGPSPKAKAAMRDALDEAHIYPDGGGYRLRGAIAESVNLGRENVVLGNGSNEIIELLCHTFLNRQTELIAAEHAFVVYKLMATLFGAKYVEVPDPGFVHDLDAMADAITPDTRLVFIANPNNPTGTMVDQAAIDRFMARLPEHVIAVFDEAYIEFPASPPDTLRYIREGRNVCVLRTFSKIHGLAGLRVGYGLAPAHLAELLQKARQPFNVNAIAQTGALAALSDGGHVAATLKVNREGMAFYENAFRERGLEFVPSHANFLLVKTGAGDCVFRDMLKQGVIVRAMSSYKLPDWIRISIGTAAQNQRCLEVLDSVLSAAAIP
jgi:histidinol-phosphate aminotransferase